MTYPCYSRRTPTFVDEMYKSKRILTSYQVSFRFGFILFLIFVIFTTTLKYINRRGYPKNENNRLLPVGLSHLDLTMVNRDVLTPPSLNTSVLQKCGIDEDRRKILFLLLKWWIEFSTKHEFVWWITDGSLLGQYRLVCIIFCFIMDMETTPIFCYVDLGNFC